MGVKMLEPLGLVSVPDSYAGNDSSNPGQSGASRSRGVKLVKSHQISLLWNQEVH